MLYCCRSSHGWIFLDTWWYPKTKKVWFWFLRFSKPCWSKFGVTIVTHLLAAHCLFLWRRISTRYFFGCDAKIVLMAANRWCNFFREALWRRCAEIQGTQSTIKKRFFVLSSFLYSIIRSKKYLFFYVFGFIRGFLIFDASKLKYTNTHTNREIERALIRWRFKMNEKFLFVSICPVLNWLWDFFGAHGSA